MVISFRISGRRRRYHPPPPQPACDYAAAAAPQAAASLEEPPPPPRPSWEASWIDNGNAAPLDLPERNYADPVEPDLEPSFTLNLFSDGYSIGEPDEEMLTYLIGDDPKKRPYSRASKALFSDIEYGCLPLEVLHGIPCKFRNGCTVCEVRDYCLLSNGSDYSGDDFPKVNRVSLRLGTESVVKDLSSIVDASWTYHYQLIAESAVLSALHPRLNLDPTSCLETLCSSKKIDLGLDKGRQQEKDESLCISANATASCKPDEFNVCKTRTVCIEGEALEGMRSGKLNSSLVNCPSMILIKSAKLPAERDPNNTIQSYTLKNNSALSDSKGSASSTASEYSIQGNELQAQAAALQVDSKNGQPQIVTVVSCKRKKCSNLVQERHESKKRSCGNKTASLNSQHSKVIEESTGTSNTERLDMGSPKFIVDQIIGDKHMKVKHERCEAPVVNLPNSAPEDLKEKRTFSVTFNGNSRQAAFKPHEYKAGTEPKRGASKGSVLGMSTIPLKQELKFKWKRQKNINTLIKSPRENRSVEEPDVIGGISSQLGIGLLLDNRRQQTKDSSSLHKTADALQNCKPIEFNAYKGPAICIENATLEGRRCVKFNSSSVNYASSIHDNDVNSSVQSDPDNTTRSSKLTNSSAKYDRKQSASKTPPGHLLQSIEQKAQVTVLPCKRSKTSKLLHEKHKSKIHISPSKIARLISENCIGLQKLAGTSNKEGLELGSPKEMHVMVDQAVGNKNMEVPQQLLSPVLPTSHLCTSSNINNPCIEKTLGNINFMYARFKESREAPIASLDNSSVADLRVSTTPSLNSIAGSKKAPFKPREDKPATESQCAASNRKIPVTSTVSSNLEIKSEGKTQEIIDTQIKSICEERSPEPPCANRSSEETRVTCGTSRQLGTSTDQRSCTEHRNTSKPDIEKILSEVILTTQRHRLNAKAARNDGLGTTSSLVRSECFQPENTEKYTYIREETISYYATGRVTSSCKIRRITFHPSQYFSCKGIVDDSHYPLFLLESQAPDDHQVIVGTIYEDEHMHIATLPTYCHAEKFVDQFIFLMKRDGYSLCEDEVLTGPSELTQKFEDVSQLCYDTGEYALYLMPSPSVVNSSPIKKNNIVGCTFQNRVPDCVDLLQGGIEHWVMTQQSRSLRTPESFFLNPSRSSGLWHTDRILHHTGPSPACNSFAMNLHQVPSVQLSQQVSMGQYLQCRHDANNVFAMDLHQLPSVQLSEVSMDQYRQGRHDVTGFGDMYSVGKSASSYGQWRPVPTQLGNVVYQWDLPASVGQINNHPVPHDWRSRPWSELQPIRSPQMSWWSMDSDGSVTSTPVQLPMPLNYQHLSV